jgi:hypothetical protein
MMGVNHSLIQLILLKVDLDKEQLRLKMFQNSLNIQPEGVTEQRTNRPEGVPE